MRKDWTAPVFSHWRGPERCPASTPNREAGSRNFASDDEQNICDRKWGKSRAPAAGARYDMRMRSRAHLLTFLFTVVVFVLPLAAHAGGVPFFGPIIPNAPVTIDGVTGNQNTCAAGWGMLITVINNIISLLITLAIVFVAPLTIAWAGFLYVVNPVDPSGIAKAKGILLNTVVGIVIALAGWMIVDAIMAVLYNPSNPGETWSSLITSGDLSKTLCIPLKGSLNQAPATSGLGAGGAQVGTARGLCADGNTACSTAAIQQGAQALNMGLTNAQTAAMSCIAMTESSGRPNTPDSNTGACGTFQITNRPGNWSNPAFHKGSCSTSSPCNDAQCNLQTALIMLNQQGYQPWTGKNPNGTYWNPNAVACVQKYDPNTNLRT